MYTYLNHVEVEKSTGSLIKLVSSMLGAEWDVVPRNIHFCFFLGGCNYLISNDIITAPACCEIHGNVSDDQLMAVFEPNELPAKSFVPLLVMRSKRPCVLSLQGFLNFKSPACLGS